MTAMGFVKSYGGLLAVRMALGLAEGGLFPGVTWYITLWYRRHECGLRMAIFFSAATLAGAFGGLLARGISEMKGKGGRPGWAWIFILEGLVTIVVALMAKFVIHDNPETWVVEFYFHKCFYSDVLTLSAKFLTEDERREVRARLKKDRSALADEYHIKYLFAALRDWKIYVHMLITIGKSPLIPSKLMLIKFLPKRYLHTSVFDLPFPPYHREEHGIHEQPIAAHECSSIRLRLFRHHLRRVLRW